MPVVDPRFNLRERVEEVHSRILDLQAINSPQLQARSKTKDIMNGGPNGISRLIGKDLSDPRAADMIPAANLMLKANDRIAQKIGRTPDIKVDPDADSDPAKDRADKRVKIIASWDRACHLRLQLPQVGRWLPGYGFVSWTFSLRKDMNGDWYPHAAPRDPFNSYPAAWTVDQRPRDIAYKHIMEPEDIQRIAGYEAYTALAGLGFPGMAGQTGANAGMGALPRWRGGVLLGQQVGQNPMQQSWSNQSGKGVEVWEYICDYGTYWVLPGYDKFLAYVPNPLDSGRSPFVVAKRFSFDQLQGQYDQLVGLMAAVARMNVIALMVAEDAVQAETNVIGHTSTGRYTRGFRATNFLIPGSSVVKMNDRIPFEALQQIDRLERQLRAMATYPITDDAVSPNSFVTGMGLEELKGSVDLEIAEYYTILQEALPEVDSIRLEMADKLLGNTRLKMWGVKKGTPFSDSYNPTTDINGAYVTRRVHGVMAGWDEPNKIVVGAALAQNEVIDTDTFRENIDGLEDHQRIKDRIKAQKVDGAMMALLSAGAQNMDPRAIEALISLLPEGEERNMYTRIFLTQPEEQQQTLQQQATPQGPIPPVTTVLNRLTNNSDPTVGVQTVGRV